MRPAGINDPQPPQPIGRRGRIVERGTTELFIHVALENVMSPMGLYIQPLYVYRPNGRR